VLLLCSPDPSLTLLQLLDILRKVSQNETEVLALKESEERKLEEIAAASDDGPIGTLRSTGGHGQQGRRVLKHLQDAPELTAEGIAEAMKVVKEEVDRRVAEIEKHASEQQRRQLRGQVHGETPKDRSGAPPFPPSLSPTTDITTTPSVPKTSSMAEDWIACASRTWTASVGF
jgi:hypothetical protein